MKTVLVAAVVSVAWGVLAYAADSSSNNRTAGQSIEEKRLEILQHIEERITLSQAEKTCVGSAQSHDEFRICREKYRPAKKDNQVNQNR